MLLSRITEDRYWPEDVCQAVRILISQPAYLDAMPFDYVERAILPAYETDNLHFTCDRQCYFTLARPVHPPHAFPTPQIFEDKGPVLWVVELVAMPHVPPRHPMLGMRWVFRHKKLAKDGDKVVFWRHRTRRYGHFTMRSSG
jgi:hypothetical protein